MSYSAPALAGKAPPRSTTNAISALTSTASSGGTLTLTALSNAQQVITGVLGHTVVLPVTQTLVLGQSYQIINNSTGTVTVQSSGLNTVVTLSSGMTAFVTCVLTSGTTAASWSVTNNSATSIPTANTISQWDTNTNFSANNVIPGYTTTVTSAGTTTLTIASTELQFFTGTTTHTVVLPVTSTLVLGHKFIITNNSTGLVHVTSSGGNIVAELRTSGTGTFVCTSTSGTNALSWSGGNVQTYSIGVNSYRITSDGTFTYVCGNNTNQVLKVDTNGTVVFAVASGGSLPADVCYDGTNVWVINNAGDTMRKIRASDGAILGTFSATQAPRGVCFDGTNVWVGRQGPSGTGGTSVLKFRASDGALLATVSVGGGLAPYVPCFDGTHIWTANYESNNVTKLNASTNAVVGLYSVGTAPQDIIFDGTYIWTANSTSTNVTKLLAATGALIGSYSVPGTPYKLCFDGTYVWCISYTPSTLVKISRDTGSVLETFVAIGGLPLGLCFDGTNIIVGDFPTQALLKYTPSATGIVASPTGVPFLGTFSPVSRDLYANTSVNNLVQATQTTVTAAGTTVLTAMSGYNQIFTGTTTQTVTLPVGPCIGFALYIMNQSTGALTVNSSNGSLVVTVAAQVSATLANSVRVVCLTLGGTTAADWIAHT